MTDILGSFLDGRSQSEDDEKRARSLSGRSAKTDRETIQWLNGNQSPEVRLIAFDSWLRKQLSSRLIWPADEAKKRRQIEQCRIHLEGLVLELWKRGWYLDGKRLATHLQCVLDSIAKYQRAGKVQDFWSYFKSSVDRYVGANAEEIRNEAMRAGSHVGQLLSALGVSKSTDHEKSLPELIAQRRDEISKEKSLREKIKEAKQRRPQNDQIALF